MHHQILAGAVMGTVIGIREAHVESKMILRIRVHLGGTNIIEALWCLTITLYEFRPKLARPFADFIRSNLVVFAVVLLLPDFEDAFFLENTNHHRRSARHALRFHLGDDFFGKRFFSA